jgi:hypothetical protein
LNLGELPDVARPTRSGMEKYEAALFETLERLRFVRQLLDEPVTHVEWTSLQNWQGRPAPSLEGSIPSPRHQGFPC